MKPRKVIVTRDDDGYLAIWHCNAKPLKDKNGIWNTRPAVNCSTINSFKFKAIFGFMPRKGSIEMLEIPQVKRKKIK